MPTPSVCDQLPSRPRPSTSVWHEIGEAQTSESNLVINSCPPEFVDSCHHQSHFELFYPPGSIGQRLLDVSCLQIWICSNYIRRRVARSQQSENRPDSNPHSTNAGFSSHYLWVTRDACQLHSSLASSLAGCHEGLISLNTRFTICSISAAEIEPCGLGIAAGAVPTPASGCTPGASELASEGGAARS